MANYGNIFIPKNSTRRSDDKFLRLKVASVPSAVEQNQTLEPSQVILTIIKADGSTKLVNAEKVVLKTNVQGKKTGLAFYHDYAVAFNIMISVPSK